MTLDPVRLVALLVVAIVVAMCARRLRLPYTVGLTVTGIALALAHVPLGGALTHDVIFNVVLPPLLFEASLAIQCQEFKRDAFPILLLSTLGVIISAAVVAGGMVFLVGWSVASALIFGVLIAATDPVAVIALFKDTGVSGRLRLLVEGESLLNDGVAAILFVIVLSRTEHHGSEGFASTSFAVCKILILQVLGGALTGLFVGAFSTAVAGRTSDHLVETALTAVAAYGSFLLAEAFGASGVLATVVAGFFIGNRGLIDGGRDRPSKFVAGNYLTDIWEFAAFLANSLIFLLIGARSGEIAFSILGWRAIVVTILTVLVSRAVSVYPLCAIFARTRRAIPINEQHVLWWGGLRGALALALALSLPNDLNQRNQITIATFAVVTFSVVVQGLTMPWLLRLTKLTR